VYWLRRKLLWRRTGSIIYEFKFFIFKDSVSELYRQWMYKADKVGSSYLGTVRALFTHKEPGGHYFSSRQACWHHLPPTSQQSQ
jgi:hypothetical protein